MGNNFLYPSSYIDAYIEFCKKQGIKMSAEFLVCAEEHLKNDFEKKSDIKINKHLSFAPPIKNEFTYVKSHVSSISLNFGVNYNSMNVVIKWSSHSGRIYEFHDKDIICTDVFFWFDNLDVALVHKYLYPKVSLPFKLKDLSYKLVVTRITMNCTLEMVLKESTAIKNTILKIDDFIADFNNKSENKDRKDGVIHNWKKSFIDEKLIYELDLGSTGAAFLKKILNYLSKINAFVRVEIC